MDMDLTALTSEEMSPVELPLKYRLPLRLIQLLARENSFCAWVSRLLDWKVPAATRKNVAARDVIIDAETGVWIRIFTPLALPAAAASPGGASCPKFPIAFYFHGGGFKFFSADSAVVDNLARDLCSSLQAMVISVDYRRTPEHQYPAAYDDGYAAVRWAADQSAAGALPNGDTAKCFLVGESAGGNIAHHVACRVAADQSLAGRVKVAGNVLLGPFFGGEERSPAELRLYNSDPMLNYDRCDEFWRLFLPDGAGRDHPAANVSGPQAPDLSGLPLAPFFVTVGEYDSLKDWQVRYVQALQRMGKDVEVRFYRGGVHCFHNFPDLNITTQFRAHLQDFVRSKLAAAA